jgi:hypothetical protein
MLSRRRALIAGGAACVLSAGALPTWYLLADRGAAIRRMIKAHMRDTPIEPGAIDSFVGDFLAYRPLPAQGVAIGNVCDALGLGDLARCANNADYLRRVEEHVIDRFVRSTDFFAPDRRAGDAVRYVAFWDPYSGSCRNPFADLSPPEEPNADRMR